MFKYNYFLHYHICIMYGYPCVSLLRTCASMTSSWLLALITVHRRVFSVGRK